MNKPVIAIAGVAFAALVAGALLMQGVGGKDEAPEGISTAPVSEDSQSVAARQYVAATAPQSHSVRPLGASPDGPPGESDEQVQRRLIDKLQTRFQSEPIDPQWARQQEATILGAFEDQPNDGFAPMEADAFQVACRASLCKIDLGFADEDAAIQAQMKLGFGLKGDISRARTFFIPRNDGGMSVLMFAGRL